MTEPGGEGLHVVGQDDVVAVHGRVGAGGAQQVEPGAGGGAEREQGVGARGDEQVDDVAAHGLRGGHRAHGPLTDLPDLAAHVPGAVMQKLTALAPAAVEIPHLPTAPGLDAAIGMSLAKLLRERAVRGEDATLQVAAASSSRW